MDQLHTLKKQLRREFKAQGGALTTDYRAAADRAIREKLRQDPRWQQARRVFIYVSMWDEPDTRVLIGEALAAGKQIYVPLCCPDRVMKAVRIRSLDELRPGTHDIPEPPSDNEAAAPGTLDLAVVPCLTATSVGARLGHGAGYYDRFLALHACPTLCLCYARLLADALPMDDNDVWMDTVLSD